MKPLIIIAALLGSGFLPLLAGPCFGAEGTVATGNLAEIETRLSTTLELSDLLDLAHVSNPSIMASTLAQQMVALDFNVEKSYPDPQLTATYFPSPIETRLGPQDWNLTLSQSFPFPGTIGLKKKRLRTDVSISRLKRDKTVRNILADVSNAFYELRYIQKAVEIAGANLALNQELVKISQNAHGQDRALVYDVSKAMAQTAQIQYDLVLLTELEQTEKTRLNTLLNRAPDALLGKARQLPPREIPHTLDEIYALAMTHQEDLLMAGQSVQRAEEAIGLTRFETLPSFKLGLFYAGIGDPDVASPPENAGDDAMGVQVGMNIPLWFDKNSSRREKALAALKKAKAEKTVAANTTKEQISRVWFRVQNAHRLIILYENQLIPQAMASVQTAETWFREGNGSFTDFLEIQATAYNFQLALERATTDYEKALVTLEQLAGVTLAENNDLVQEGRP